MSVSKAASPAVAKTVSHLDNQTLTQSAFQPVSKWVSSDLRNRLVRQSVKRSAVQSVRWDDS